MTGRRSERLTALALLGVVLFNYPVLSLFAVDGKVLGVPVLYAYFFTVWAGLIAAVARLNRAAARG
ncbi:MAG: hypothetical protein LLP51_07690 [Halorhodospira halophila]|uniref:hypothetical protein n=1 Tax=Halorhodospira TaxID=85108 RepID=UPI00191292B4|nr:MULTISPECIES: hypothetical protein [Halorhodospira]MBK5937311.1 hypothetical protein [Halorhodospira halophila]MCC3751262.1 hypothetical protein [Halorhodospira halophila]MCG5527665.1 hypothetical protein [Halorhodospira halophila]MCG5532682.1 hypothetical protein [Halorhodospira sp. 9621]MCG5537708.1 hypothetical protein [Halorhodospira sp. 9622]